MSDLSAGAVRLILAYEWPPRRGPGDHERIVALLAENGFTPREIEWLAMGCPSFEYCMTWMHKRRAEGWKRGFELPTHILEQTHAYQDRNKPK